MKSHKKSVGDGITMQNASWSFGGDTAKHFAEHVERSVPLYKDGHELVCQYSDFFIKDDSVCYELGVSVGDLIKKLASHHSKKNARFIGIDCEEPMIEEARKNIAGNPKIELVTEDISVFPFEKCDLMISYYVIQFIHPKIRQELYRTIYDSLNWGGALLLFEKTRGPDARFQDITTAVYNEYKLANGYNADEITAKSRSLKGVLEPFSSEGNIDLLRRAGFKDIMCVMKYICFEGFLAIK